MNRAGYVVRVELTDGTVMPVDVDAVIAALRTEAQSEQDEGALSAYGYALDLLTGKALP